MTKKINMKEIVSGMVFPLFGGSGNRNDIGSPVSKQLFCDEFLMNWENSVTAQKMEMLACVKQLDPEEGVEFAILGLQDLSRVVRQEAKDTLKFFSHQVMADDTHGHMTREKIIASEKFAQVLFKEMQKTISLDELREYVTLLLEINGRGPGFAWTFFLNNTVPQNVLIDILRRFPEPLRLRFVFPYLFSDVSDRRKYAPLIRLLLKDISDSDAVHAFIRGILSIPSDCLYSIMTRTGSLLYDFVARFSFVDTLIRKGLDSKDTDCILDGALFAAAFERNSRLYPFLDYLSQAESEDLRISLLDVIARSRAEGDGRILSAVNALLGDSNEAVVLKAFSTLVALDAQEMVTTACLLIESQPSMRLRLYKCLERMKAEDLIRVLERLPEAQAFDARRIMSRILLRKNPERILVLFGNYRTDPDTDTRKAADALFVHIEKIQAMEKKKLIRQLSAIPLPLSMFEKKTSKIRLDKILKYTNERQGETKLNIRGEVFNGLDLLGVRMENLDLRDTVFLNCDVSSAHIISCDFKGARFVNVTMKHIHLEKSSFENCQFENVDGDSAHVDQCLFLRAFFQDVRFEFSEIHESYFTGASFLKSNLSRSDLSFSCFTGAVMGLSDFSHCSVFRADFDHVQATLCAFTGTSFESALVYESTDFAKRSELWDELEIPPHFFGKNLLDTRWMNILVLTHEMDRQREVFIRHNQRARERALDSFRAEQEDLFEMVPLLIHLTQRLLPIEKKSEDSYLTENMMLKNASSGISNYTPSPKTVSLVKKYLRVDKLLLLPGKDCHIEALFTIGSIGTIAQSSDSDLDYWVCVDRTHMGEDAEALLKLKLESIERWAKVRFGTELHFFVVDPESVREGRFGGSDFESSGSAQGMILKEEFYRTMILVAGKIPFWSVLPAWTDNRYYQLLYSISCRFYQDYLDLGNVSSIPAGEYFGASMWQLFKSLTSPYKSVMKMALLEKYIHEGKKGLLLCNRLKGRWASGKYHFRRQDPYILLFDEITDYYKHKGQDDIVSLVKSCFFLKLSIRTGKHLEQSIFKIRKLMMEKCVERYGWDMNQIYDLAHFDEWTYEKVLDLSSQVNGFMIETYNRLSGMLNHSPDMETMITSQDLTILGRKMFTQFSSHPYKVKTLPHVARGMNLFKQLFIYYRQAPRTRPVWDVYPYYDKQAMVNGNDWAILRDVDQLEEVAAWVIHNGIYQSGTRFNILPNPSSVSAQDFHDLLKDMNDFFVFGEGDTMSPGFYLEAFKMFRIYMIANFTQSRKSDRIFEYAAVYMTTWGEVFCRKYTSKKGLSSISETIDKVEKDLGLACRNVKIGYHIPRMSKKRIVDKS
ncbi:MAG: class I adenylate cyclase [Proteobacteria bacterium]|nr:class I adenylate cyclase [Pseudomonadota bacterium]